VQEALDAEGKIMARDMGQEYPVWVADAIAHHLYRCELIACQQRLHDDEMSARKQNIASPVSSDPQYQPKRPKPNITRKQPPGGGGPGRSYGPK